MTSRIGEAAGRVWQALSEHGSLDITRLAKMIQEKESLIHQAIGWLAREDKIDLQKKGQKLTLSLKK